MKPQVRQSTSVRDFRVKHVQTLDSFSDGQISFEILFCLFLFLNLALVYLNIYKTVWWLPTGPSNTFVNFYLIDWAALLFLILIICCRLQYVFSLKLSIACDEKFIDSPWVQCLALLLLPVIIALCLSFCILELVRAQKIWQSLFLVYPLVLGVLFKSTISAILQGNASTTSKILSQIENSPKIDSYTIFGMRHVCNSDTKHIRSEAKVFWSDSWAKFQLIVALSALYTYYIGLIPIVLIPENLIYDLTWILLEAVFFFETTMMLLFLHFMPANYFNELYSCALHLGIWRLFEENSVKSKGNHSSICSLAASTGYRREGDQQDLAQTDPSFFSILFQVVIPDFLQFTGKADKDMALQARKAGFTEWSPSGTVEKGAMVIYGNRIYCAASNFPAAEPANSQHAKFYMMFAHPLSVHSAVLFVHVSAILGQLCLLLFCYSHWNETVTLAITMFINHYVLFHLMRDHFLMRSLYSTNNNNS
ncbi:transmembrane protein 39A-like isoform X2 [Symsagittifera roscoffensis]|uniref:transmembrane protein 39A-like isoform X2 n=1 Tax=Symsagittifera roscoffensis TaxID=84072 RepID=UPI00307BEE90